MPGRFLGPASLLVGLASLLAWVAWTHGRVRTRRGARVLAPDVDRIPASRLTSALLLAALLTVCAAEVLGVLAVVLEPAAVAETATTTRGSALGPVVIGAVLLLLLLFRVVTGRARPFVLSFSDDGLRYRGWRQDRFVAWGRIRWVAVDRRRYDLVVQPKGTKQDPVRVPLVMFDAAPASLVAAVEARRSSRRPRRAG